MKLTLTSKYLFIGAAVGYFVVHPLVMMTSHIMFEGMFDHSCTLIEFILSEILQAFSLKMLLWSLSTTLFCAIIGYFYGKVKQNETALREANSTKDTFFSILAHDLKSPVVNLVSASDVLAEKYDRFDDERRKRYIDNMYDSSKRLHDLLENLLTWSRIQTGKMQWSPMKLHLSSLVEETMLLLKTSAEEKHLTLSSKIPENTTVYADANMVMTILRNLVSNAIKFTPAGGEVNISSTRFGTYVELTVSDTGVGIGPEDQHKLFKVDATYSTPGTAGERGTGLGLVLCKEFIEKHGGSIQVESEVGKGSHFIFTLPHKEGVL